MNTFYSSAVNAVSGRNGTDSLPDLQLALPAKLGGEENATRGNIDVEISVRTR